MSNANPQLTLSAEEMRRLGYQVVDLLVDHFERLREKPSTRQAGQEELAEMLADELPEQPTPFSDLLRELEDRVFAHMGLTTHPRFFAFVPSPSNYISVLGDAIASGFNAFLGNWMEAAGPSRIEQITVGWLRELCGFPETAGGVFVSGGSVANLTGLAVARHVKLNVVGSLRDPSSGHGVTGPHLPVAYCSDQTHSSIDRAFRVLGFRPDQLVKIPSDEQFRLPLNQLRQQVVADQADGKTPFCVIANAGSTNTGAVDPLVELAAFCRQEDLWLHVDGAYGAAAMICDEGRKLLDGLPEADSLAIDPHKWLFQPYEIGCVLLRDWRQLHETFRMSAEYLDVVNRVSGDVNFQDCGIQLTRGFRALKLWLSLKYFGLDAFRQAVARGIELAEYAEEMLRVTPGMDVVTPAQLAIVTFRYVPEGTSADETDAVNDAIVPRLLTDGFATVTATTLRGRKVLRFCTINPRTTEEDIRETIARIKELAAIEA